MKIEAEVLHSMLLAELQSELDLVTVLHNQTREILLRVEAQLDTLEAIEADERPPAEVIPINKKERAE